MALARIAGARLRRLFLAAAVVATASTVGAPAAGAADDGWTTIDDTAVGSGADTISYSGSWSTDESDASTGATVHRSARRGSAFTLRFTGSAVSLLGVHVPSQRHVAVSLDHGGYTVPRLHRWRHGARAPIPSE